MKLRTLFRHNLVAFVALFVALSGTAYAANTVRSSDIVDGTIQAQDLHAGAVTPAKSTDLWTFHNTAIETTSSCVTQSYTWTACASVALTVPTGHYDLVTVISSVTANPGGTSLSGSLYCPASQGPTCMTDSYPERAAFPANVETSATTTRTAYFGPGNWQFNTALDFQVALPVDAYAHTTTTVFATDITNSAH
ncbi:MAG TPA: hypothetical protein VGO03_13730 [Acidimicrobiia bacterium]|jgi:hypothetical protein